MCDVVALGELLIDFACQSTDAAGYPTLAANPGGAPANYLAALQQYGCTTAMIGKVGEDAFGHLLIGTLKQCGIDTRGVLCDGSVFTTLAFVTLDADGNRSFSFARKPGADTCLQEDELLPLLPMIDDCRVFHFGTTGAGDIFGGSAMSCFLRMNKSPKALNADELREIVRFACCAASLSTQKMGGLSSIVPLETVLNAME